MGKGHIDAWVGEQKLPLYAGSSRTFSTKQTLPQSSPAKWKCQRAMLSGHSPYYLPYVLPLLLWQQENVLHVSSVGSFISALRVTRAWFTCLSQSLSFSPNVALGFGPYGCQLGWHSWHHCALPEMGQAWCWAWMLIWISYFGWGWTGPALFLPCCPQGNV